MLDVLCNPDEPVFLQDGLRVFNMLSDLVGEARVKEASGRSETNAGLVEPLNYAKNDMNTVDVFDFKMNILGR